ncbi:class I SAM-dependent methyltransferase [Mitsuokella sp.]|uniref:class I SAM-dependent methyltransferase n=1 Tax=Mitsuokella sp. TaxID=2049034 RepID=UPI002A83EACE|nr:class I SAM-dependent methyltransferase [Mitsuokella sp.]MDY4474147.1 class I SAM-dependent methyltransferase [Mitsuokella sp.]
MERYVKIKQAYRRVGMLASSYDGMMTNSTWLGHLALRLFWGFTETDYRRYIQQAFAGIPAGFDGRLLEVPVGTGALSLPVYRDLPRADITCLDFSAEMLEKARERAQAMELPQLRFLAGDVGNLPFREGSFDLVLSINGFHAFPDKPAAFRETHRVLKKDGIFTGCVYIRGQHAVTDLFVRTFCSHQGYFTPPFDTLASLQERLQRLYRDVRVCHIGSFACFTCRK